jgi:20S proteasome alpha/beta subunit
MAISYNSTMTVILAATYDEGAGAIIVSDKMRTTTHQLTGEVFTVENDEVRKIFKLNDTTTIAYSGDNEFWSEIIKAVEQEIHKSDKFKKVRAIIEKKYHINYVRYQWSEVLGFLGFESVKDYNARAPKELSQDRIKQIDERLMSVRTTGEMVLVGLENGKYEIYSLYDPGIFKPNSYGFSVAGSGITSGGGLVVEQYLKKMNKAQVKKLLLAAKKLAENDTGVGKQTQIVCLP